MSEEIEFLEVEDILIVHRNQIDLYGGSSGVRDRGLLESAVNAVQASFDGEYMHKTLYERASAYIFYLAQNHPFIDGNKRTALATGLVYLDMNGIEIDDPNEELYAMMIEVSTGNSSKEKVSEVLKRLTA
ncbi:MAG TPA: type II toxin-antitoxin system death-on-curing family toxin [Leptospiraceae bacterium]|nr:type II toxin-antitoxin system death-on-curing family toxin [Leptospiraceae bacterium]